MLFHSSCNFDLKFSFFLLQFLIVAHFFLKKQLNQMFKNDFSFFFAYAAAIPVAAEAKQ